MYRRFRENESTLFEAALESKKEKLRRKTPKRKTPNAVKARGAHGALRAQLRKYSRAGAQHRIQRHAVKFWRRPALRPFFNLSI
jgi:hypothetical protein